jgi:heterodisulfide reductase subunit A
MIEEDGRVVDAPHDLVVLSVGMQPGDDPRRFINVDLDLDRFIAAPDPKLDATLTSLPGVVAAGTALGPKDIVDTVVEASAAATKVAMYLGPPPVATADDTNLHVEIREMSVAEAVVAAGLTEVHGA